MKNLDFLYTNQSAIRTGINAAYRCDERTLLQDLLQYAQLSDYQAHKAESLASDFIKKARAARRKITGIDTFLTEYALSSDEGIALMCLAEALLRIPDKATIDSLIKDKLTQADWQSHLGESESFYINATTWALMLTGKILKPEGVESRLVQALRHVAARSSESVIRLAVNQAMRLMSRQFVMGETIEAACARAKKKEAAGYRYSYDMLGEAAITRQDAEAYFDAYLKAIETIGASLDQSLPLIARPGVSIKLSALHPRYHEAYRDETVPELSASLLRLAQAAKRYDIPLTVDAEEAVRLELSLDVIERVFCDASLSGWMGFGLAVQSYQKRAFSLLDWVYQLAKSQNRQIMVRLIKGAYWDTEIKQTQVLGLLDYPVFTRKVNTDVSFQACAKKLLGMTDWIYPQFATHNAYSVAVILAMAGDRRDFEFQCLHGMGNELYAQIVPEDTLGIPCRIYAPVGTHEHLLPYLVRRLLENGANSSFVNRLVDDKEPIHALVRSPIEAAREVLMLDNPHIQNPSVIFLPERLNSQGFDLSDRAEVLSLQMRLGEAAPHSDTLLSYLNRANPSQSDLQHQITIQKPLIRPADTFSPGLGRREKLGGYLKEEQVQESTADEIDAALRRACGAFDGWAATSVHDRACALERYAELLETHRESLWMLLCLEAGKTWQDSIAEVREAVDFCRYYAHHARLLMGEPQVLQGYTGELNTLSLHPRGVVLCISPWNFPLAIFTGQIVAALVCGNCVIAKPAEQTPRTALRALELMHEAGIPAFAIQCVLGRGEVVGAKLVASPVIKAVIFTGSTDTANHINQTLAMRGGEIIPLIAETGGINAMIVDSSALLEQMVQDVIQSAFGSAGQRCSALRVLYLQEEIYPRTIALLQGAMAELKVGDPRFLSTDVGPVIDGEALDKLKTHVETMRASHEIIYQCPFTDNSEQSWLNQSVVSDNNFISPGDEGNHDNPLSPLGERVRVRGDTPVQADYFMPPTAIRIDSIQSLPEEVFGPVLHVIRYARADLEQIIDEINSTGFGLTLGIQSRITHTAEWIAKRIHAGNCYVNRTMTGAVVGLQPFGGHGLSGTGPKAGGPYYLQRLCVEKTWTVDTTAAGGNAALMSLS